MPHYKESTEDVFLVWTVKTTIFCKASLCRTQESSFFSVIFPWHLCVLLFLSFFLQIFSSAAQSSFCPALYLFCSFYFPGLFVSQSKISGSDLYSFLLPSSLALIPFWIYFRPARICSYHSSSFCFPKHTSQKKNKTKV